MTKKIVSILTICVLVATLVAPASAKTFTGEDDWYVTFTAEAVMESSFTTDDLSDVIQGMQPGDDAIITLTLRNSHRETTNWYMTNEVLQSLEDESLTATGGAYTYRLTYVGPDGEEDVLYDSDTVGGEDNESSVRGNDDAGEGLNAATSALDDFFYLDTLKTGETGTITLLVALDGESQGNDYQDTMAVLQMNFAVELETDNTTIVYTGDEDLTPYFIAAGVTGAIILGFGVYSLKSRRKAEKADKEGE